MNAVEWCNKLWEWKQLKDGVPLETRLAWRDFDVELAHNKKIRAWMFRCVASVALNIVLVTIIFLASKG